MGVDEQEFLRTPNLEGFIALNQKQSLSNFPEQLIHLGHSAKEEIYLTQEDRVAHLHILGSPDQGKSKFLELLIRADINNGHGVCLLDPGDNGDTAKKILKYCASIGFEKVCYINPIDFFEFKRVPTFNPIKYEAPPAVSAGNLLDTIQVLWNTSDFSDTPDVLKFTTALLYTLHRAQGTLPDSKYLLNLEYPEQRNKLLKAAIPEHATQLRSNKLSSTLNRFNVYKDEHLSVMLGSTLPGIPFMKMITEGWVILVNLDPQSVWGVSQQEQRALGTLLINEITYAIHRLRENEWKGVYYLYIDEVGDYATQKLAFILDKKRKTGAKSFCMEHSTSYGDCQRIPS